VICLTFSNLHLQSKEKKGKKKNDHFLVPPPPTIFEMVQWALVLHGVCTATVVVSFLCGQWPIFEGTFIERLHYFLTFGAYDYFLYAPSPLLF
jgi:hypothetical protein